MARAFRNLCVDLVDAFKFGIKWDNKFYLDVALAFGWVHGSASFQMTSDAILYIMRRHKCRICAYIDDFIIVSQENDAERHYHPGVKFRMKVKSLQGDPGSAWSSLSQNDKDPHQSKKGDLPYGRTTIRGPGPSGYCEQWIISDEDLKVPT